ncbi:thiamine pyrophosphate-dependent enzyme [Synergistaceae bacterium OttesenSCG-928-D05]|nr:thiamine pyrophosphate-dependent enzyme [Synergistaceae bacterium OttesenSCG-928-D05]
MTEKTIYKRPKSWKGVHTHYCPGCTHGIIHKMICQAIDELGIQEKTVGIAPVGCAVLIYNYTDVDFVEAAHGRAPAIATGIKRVRPDRIVFSYQGDGDLASIGMAEIVHAANRGENITVIFVNNAIYGMTGGQMAPTTLLEQKTTTTQSGRDAHEAGYPIRVCEMLATMEAPAYIERVSAASYKHLPALRNAIKKAFQNQVEGKGFSLVEVLSTCPTNWGMRPLDAVNWLDTHMIPFFPLGKFKDFDGGEA